MACDPDELAWLCAKLTELRTFARRFGLTEELNVLLDDIRSGQDIGDRVLCLVRQMGIPAGTTRSPGLQLPGLGGGKPAAEAYRCPEGQCSWTWIRPPGETVATCGVYGKPLMYTPDTS